MKTVQLHEPLVVREDSWLLNRSREIAGYRFEITPYPRTFPTATLGRPYGLTSPLTAFGMLTLPPGSRDIRITDCEFVGPWDSILDVPHIPPGNPRFLRGIDMYYSTGIRVEGVQFENLPHTSIRMEACQGISLEDVWGRRCRQLVKADWMGTPRCRWITMNRLHFADGWAFPKEPAYNSLYDPRRGIGANAVGGYYVDSSISRVTTSGEVKAALKLTCPVRVDVTKCDLVEMMQQGSLNWDDDQGPVAFDGFDDSHGIWAKDVTYRDCTVRAAQSAWLQTEHRNPIQWSYRAENIRWIGGVIHRSAERQRPGIQLVDGVEADFRDALFVGWDGPDGVVDLRDYGKPASLPATINADFGSVNRFRE
jgi:hypothetical protein